VARLRRRHQRGEEAVRRGQERALAQRRVQLLKRQRRLLLLGGRQKKRQPRRHQEARAAAGRQEYVGVDVVDGVGGVCFSLHHVVVVVVVALVFGFGDALEGAWLICRQIYSSFFFDCIVIIIRALRARFFRTCSSSSI
jgi:hypothetical protein